MIIETIPAGPLKANCYLLGCEETGDAVVIDPGGDAQNILGRIRSIDLTVKFILNTHGHFDHVGGNKALKEATGAELWIHAKDAYLLSQAVIAAADFGVRVERSPQPDRFLNEDFIVEFGTNQLQVIHTPGHSPGGCCLYCKSERMVFTGDTLFNGSIGRYDLLGGYLPALMTSLREKVMTLPSDTQIFPGHGPSTNIGREWMSNPHIPRRQTVP